MKKQWCNVCKFNTYGCDHGRVVRPHPSVMHARLMARPSHSRPPVMRPIILAAPCEPMVPTVVCVEPQVSFLPMRLVVAPVGAEDFVLSDFKVGSMPQEVSWGCGIGGDAFPPYPKNTPVNNIEGFDLVHVEQLFSLRVTNVGRDSRTFRAVVFGMVAF